MLHSPSRFPLHELIDSTRELWEWRTLKSNQQICSSSSRGVVQLNGWKTHNEITGGMKDYPSLMIQNPYCELIDDKFDWNQRFLRKVIEICQIFQIILDYWLSGDISSRNYDDYAVETPLLRHLIQNLSEFPNLVAKKLCPLWIDLNIFSVSTIMSCKYIMFQLNEYFMTEL